MDRPRPRHHGPQRVMQAIPNAGDADECPLRIRILGALDYLDSPAGSCTLVVQSDGAIPSQRRNARLKLAMSA